MSSEILIIRGTKRFKVEYAKSLDGPWIKILEKDVADNRSTSSPPYVMTYMVDVVFARYVKLTCLAKWQYGCGLQYFAVN